MNLPVHPSVANTLQPAYKKIAASLASASSEDGELMFELFGKLLERHISNGECGCGNSASHSILDEIQLLIALEMGAR